MLLPIVSLMKQNVRTGLLMYTRLENGKGKMSDNSIATPERLHTDMGP